MHTFLKGILLALKNIYHLRPLQFKNLVLNFHLNYFGLVRNFEDDSTFSLTWISTLCILWEVYLLFFVRV